MLEASMDLGGRVGEQWGLQVVREQKKVYQKLWAAIIPSATTHLVNNLA